MDSCIRELVIQMVPSSSGTRTAGESAPCGIDIEPDRDSVKEAMARLSDSHRAMIYHCYYLGRTTTQIAAELGAADEVVKAELHCALHALRTTLHSARRSH